MELHHAAGVVLASPPQRPGLPYKDRPVLAAVLEMVGSWGLAAPVVVVFSPETEYLISEVELGDVVAVVSEETGPVSSALSAGLDAVVHLLPDTQAAFVVEGDVPLVPASLPAALAAELTASQRLAAAPQYRYVRGGPVLVGRQLWDRLMADESDQSLVNLLVAHPDWTATVIVSARPPVAVR